VITGYRDLVRIAVGGFSTVYTAYEETLGRTVAVKVLHADAHDPTARRRFQHECELTGRLTGRANIITVFAAGPTADDRFYIAMQYLPNGSLADRLAAAGPMPVQEVLRIGLAIARALETAHAAGILHRDIKPGNILVSDQGEPVLSDFGIASLINPAGNPTDVDAFTRGHTAPEVIDGYPPSAQSDIYALGSTLCTLLTGVQPADGHSGPPTAERVQEPMGLNRPDVPAGLVALLRRTLAADPRQRPATAAELVADLTALLGGPQQPPPATAPTPAPAVAPAPAVTATAFAETTTGADPVREPTRLRESRIIKPGTMATQKSSHRTMTIVAGLVAAAVVVAAGSAFAITRGRPHHSSSAAAAAAREPGVGTVTVPASAGGAPPATAAAARTTVPAGNNAPSMGGPAGGQPQPSQATPKPTPKPTLTEAAPPPPTVCTPGGCAGKAYFVAYGDHLFVCDEKSDGYSAVAMYTRTDVPGQNNEAAERTGAGKCVDHNMNLAEGAKITFKICLENGSGPLFSCSAAITATA
jgi:serine/threonine-protein kinase PknK